MANESALESKNKTSGIDFSTKRILIVDDNSINSNILDKQLTAWETTSASSIGAESAISGDGGNSWGSGRADGVFILMGTCND